MSFRNLLIIFLALAMHSINAQEDTISFNILKSPNSPAFQLLEVDEEKVDRPSSPTDFELNIQEATQDFSVIPKNYSIEIAPVWLFWGQKYSFEDYKSNTIKNNIPQSLILSFGTVTRKDSLTLKEYRKFGLGVKFSLFRGYVRSDEKIVEISEKLEVLNSKWAGNLEKIVWNDTIYTTLHDIYNEVLNLLDKDKDNKELRYSANMLEEALDLRKSELDTTIVRPMLKREKKELKESAEDLKLNRYGFKLDFAFGLSLNFPTNDFTYSEIDKAALWFTGGWDFEDKKSLFAVSRLFITPYKDSTKGKNILYNIDLGLKGILDDFYKFSISTEVIYRVYLNSINNEENKVRFTLNLGYEIFKNKLVTFNLGKDFDKNFETGGNLIATLNLILGFGSMRPF